MAVDRYTKDGLMEIYLKEVNYNEMEDVKITPEIEPIDKTKPYINGLQVVHPYDTDLIYSIQGANGGIWKAPSAFKQVKITYSDDLSCTIDIITGRSNNFVLQYVIGDEVIAELPIRIDSL